MKLFLFFTITFLISILVIYFKLLYLPTTGNLFDSSRISNLSRFFEIRYFKLLVIFIVFNIGLIGLFSLFHSIRVFLLIIIAMMPNIYITMGGAELSGWATHYHSMYLPFLIFLSLLGFSEGISKKKFILIKCFLGLSLLILFSFNVNTFEFHHKLFKNYKYGIFYNLKDYYFNGKSSHIKFQIGQIKKIDQSFPEHANISMPEYGMPGILNGYRHIYYYPLGIYDSEYVLLKKDFNNNLYGAVTYTGDENATFLNNCINKKLRLLNFDFDNPYLESDPYVILKKK